MFKDNATEALYGERLRRYVTAMGCGVPDRIPIRLFLQEAAARYVGYTNQQVACDYGMAFETTRLAAEGLGVDSVMLNAIWSNYGVGKSASWRYLHIPGVDVGLGSVSQYSEPEGEGDAYMKADEYGELIDDPTAFILTKWLPRASARLSPPGDPVTLGHNAALISGALAYADYMGAFGPAAARLRYESGIVGANAGMVKAPLDILADKFRGYLGTAIDAGERPGDVLRACEALMPHILANALAGADPERNVPVTVWAHRGCVPFFSMETFDSVYWPTLRPILEEIIKAGHRVLFYGEGNWEAHYGALRGLPAGSMVYHLDRGDPSAAASAFKGRHAISGGMPYDVLARGTADEVRESTLALLKVMKPGGGYVFDCSALMLDDICPENLRAAVGCVMEHGAYSASSGAAPHVAAAGGSGADCVAEAWEAGAREAGVPDAGADLGVGAGAAEGVRLGAFRRGARPPMTVRPWDEESRGYKALSGDVAMVERVWKARDAAAYGYLWTTVLW